MGEGPGNAEKTTGGILMKMLIRKERPGGK